MYAYVANQQARIALKLRRTSQTLENIAFPFRSSADSFKRMLGRTRRYLFLGSSAGLT